MCGGIVFVTLKCRVFVDQTGAYTEIPATLTPAGWLMPLVDYCVAHSHSRSPSWMLKVNRSVRLFLAYLLANPDEHSSYTLFQNFAQRLYTGTFDRNSGLDPSWLCWRPVSTAEAARTIRNLTDFFGWLGGHRPAGNLVNPRYTGNAYDRMADEAAYRFRRDLAFLGHTWNPHGKPGKSHIVRARRTPKAEKEEPPAFPDDRFMDLLGEGFVVAGRPNYRDMLITLLLHGAGFRYSEPFHLYLTDVSRDKANHKQAEVQIHHPSDGVAPKDRVWMNERGEQKTGIRATYLAERYSLSPRHQLLDSRAAGWKGGAYDGEWFKRAYWFVPMLGELFLTLWYRYLEQVARMERSHPFAWVNLSQEPKGGMYCLMQYWRAHARACRRIGLEVGKELGTTPHGHRHAYGRRLAAGGLSEDYIRRCLHHAGLDSQGVYTSPTTQQIRDSLLEGAERLNTKYRRDI